jgi:hypothetical protein
VLLYSNPVLVPLLVSSSFFLFVTRSPHSPLRVSFVRSRGKAFVLTRGQGFLETPPTHAVDAFSLALTSSS